MWSVLVQPVWCSGWPHSWNENFHVPCQHVGGPLTCLLWKLAPSPPNDPFTSWWPVHIPTTPPHRKGAVKLDGSDPLLLYGYGAYELNADPYFSSTRLCLLDRGWVFAIAHIRGGGEMGRFWCVW